MSNYECTLDGTRLSSLDESICILDICEDAPVMRVATLAMAGGGQRLLSRVRESLSVQVSFAIQEADIARRREIFHSVLGWAEKGGALVISSRPGQQLQVICTALPAIHTEDWAEPLRITFTTTAVPYWETIEFISVDLTETDTLTLPGNALAAPSAMMIVNNGDASITTLTLTCGETQMVFDGMELPAGGFFTLRQLENIVYAEADDVNVLPCRTADSDDLLLIPCGTACKVSVTADQPVDAALSARGRYL